MRRFIFIFLSSVAFNWPGRAGAQTTQSDDAGLKRDAAASIEKEMRSLPDLGEHHLSDVISFVMRDGKLFPETRMPVADEGYVKITGLPGWSKVHVLGRQTLRTAGNNHYLQWVYCDVSVPDTIEVFTEVYSSPTVVNISREAELADDGMMSVQFIQAPTADNNAVSLYIQSVSAAGKSSPTARRITGASLADLTQTHPAEVDQYLRPIFRMLGQEQVVFEVDGRTAYQVLASLYPVEAATKAEVDEAVKNLGADAYGDREAAMRKLRDLAQPAAIYLMQAGKLHVSAEQSMRVDLFLAQYRPLSDEDARRMAGDIDFLLDCRFSRDVVIRGLAQRQYKIVTGKDIGALGQLSGPALSEALAKLRP